MDYAPTTAVVGWTLAQILLVGFVLGCSSPGDPPELHLAAERDGVLAVPPLVGRPTASSVTLQLVAGDQPVHVKVRLDDRTEVHRQVDLKAEQAYDLVLQGLEPDTVYRYHMIARGQATEVHTGRFVTRRAAGSAFRFALFSDPHLPVPAPEWLDPAHGDLFSPELHDFLLARLDHGGVLRQTLAAIREHEVDFIVCLGDMLHFFRGFNDPFPSLGVAESGYLDLRTHLGQAGAEAALFAVIGNWDGESGWQPERLRDHARRARMKLLPNPSPSQEDDGTYLPGGSPAEDYYAWHWGDALLVVLNVMTYTPTKHTMGPDDDGTAEDWTLGPQQLTWLETTLATSDARFKLLFIHHAVGGSGGDAENSAYGRGGGRAARVGEQARVHELMLEHGVQVFFYGHDHVATDLTVDGIHYTLPGSAGAPWKFETAETGYSDYQEASSYALVTVEPEQLGVEVLDLEGQALYRYMVY